jgi:hypothetical protein
MDAISITNINAEAKRTATVANALRIDDGTGETVETAATIPPFFRLPRELRDEIYDLAALEAKTFFYDITLRADMPPQKAAYVDRGAGRVFSNSQFEVEYSAAVEKRVKLLVSGADRYGFKLYGPGTVKTNNQAENIWLGVSKAQQEEGKISHNVYDLKLVIPIRPDEDTRLVHDYPSVVFAFKFPEKAKLGPRVRFDCYWDRVKLPHFGDSDCLRFPSDDGSILEQILSIAKKVNWKGSIREYLVWQRFIVIHAQRGASSRV